MEPTVSVVITNFNYGRFVAQAIESALDQRGANVEVIVVDDGSTDGSRAVIERFAGRIKAIFTPNAGQGAAFNVGWRAAVGDIVMFLDADDILFPDTASLVAATFAQHPCGSKQLSPEQLSRVQFPLRLIDAGGRPTGGTIPAAGRRLFEGDATPSLTRCPDDIVWQPTSGNAFSRRSLDPILPMPEAPYRICADYYLSNLTPLHGPVAALSAAGGGYRVHADNSHFSSVENLDRLRENVRRTSITHAHLIAECRRLGIAAPADHPDAVRSVTATANRLISYRLDRSHHPLGDDTRGGLLCLGVRSAGARRDVNVAKRIAFATWFVAAAIVPRVWLRVVAKPYVTLDRTNGNGTPGVRSGVFGEPGDHENNKDERRDDR